MMDTDSARAIPATWNARKKGASPNRGLASLINEARVNWSSVTLKKDRIKAVFPTIRKARFISKAGTKGYSISRML